MVNFVQGSSQGLRYLILFLKMCISRLHVPPQQSMLSWPSQLIPTFTERSWCYGLDYCRPLAASCAAYAHSAVSPAFRLKIDRVRYQKMRRAHDIHL